MQQASDLAERTSLIDIDETFLPVAQMRQITQVTLIQESEIEGRMELGPDHWVYPQHFPGDPIFPGTLLIEGAGQLVALYAWSDGRRGYPRLVRTSAKFHEPVAPETTALELRAIVQRKRHLYFGQVQVFSAQTLVATIDAVLTVLAAK